MTIPELEQSIMNSGLRCACGEMYPNGEVPIHVTDQDGNGKVTLRFFYRVLDNPQLPDTLLQLYFNELAIRRQKKMEKKKA